MGLSEVIEKYYETFPETRDVGEWAGCNYNKNFGSNEFEPKGTAQSMHDCIGCEKREFCTIKQETPIWEIDDLYEKRLEFRWNKMIDKLNKQ